MFKLFRRINFYLPVITMCITGAFWCFTINGIPPRVEKLENDVKKIQEQNIQYNVKTDIILDDVKYLKQLAIENRSKL